MRTALPLSRLEVRLLAGSALKFLPSRSKANLPTRSSSNPIRWSNAAACCGPTWVLLEHKPPLPEWEFATVPAKHRFISKRFQECNYLQAMEGGINSSHVSFLHSGNLESDPLFKGAKGNKYNLSDMQPHFEVVESPGGLYIGARRNAEDGNYYWRITQWVMPSFTMVPAARRLLRARAFLDPDRRRELLGLELRLSSDARTDGCGS